jgi:hypothetical protein
MLEFILTETGRNRRWPRCPWPIASLIGKLGDMSPIIPWTRR